MDAFPSHCAHDHDFFSWNRYIICDQSAREIGVIEIIGFNRVQNRDLSKLSTEKYSVALTELTKN